MRLKTIWTIPAMSLVERLRRTQEWCWQRAAYHLPKRLAYWSFINSGVQNIRNDETVPEVRYTEILQRMSPNG